MWGQVGGAPNLMAAGKLMSESFHANSNTRLHPSEWTSGVAAGGSGGAVGGSMTGWTAVGAAGNQKFSPGNASQIPKTIFGEQHAYTNGTNASVSQVTPLTITAGETYTLTVDVGQVSNFSNSQGTIRLFGSTLGLGTALSNSNGTAELSGITPPNQSTSYLVNQTISYTALASGDPFEGQQIGIALVNSVGTQTLFDNVRLEAVGVPEPSSLALLGLGGLALLRRKRH